jgi:hypothetical protein
MGDWRQPREGLTANERGLPLKWTDELIGKLGLKVARRRFCMFSPLRIILLKCGFKRLWASAPVVWIDWLLSPLMSFNVRDYRDTFWKKCAPSSVFYVPQKYVFKRWASRVTDSRLLRKIEASSAQLGQDLLPVRGGHQGQGEEVVAPAFDHQHFLETRLEQEPCDSILSEARLVGHEMIAPRNRGGVAIDHVEGGDWPQRRLVGDCFGATVRDQGSDWFEIRGRDQGEAIGLQDPGDAAYRKDHVMWMKMLYAVRAKNRIEASVGNLAQVFERADNVGRDFRIDVHPHFLPGAIAKGWVQAIWNGRPASGVENLLHHG